LGPGNPAGPATPTACAAGGRPPSGEAADWWPPSHRWCQMLALPRDSVSKLPSLVCRSTRPWSTHTSSSSRTASPQCAQYVQGIDSSILGRYPAVCGPFARVSACLRSAGAREASPGRRWITPVSSNRRTRAGLGMLASRLPNASNGAIGERIPEESMNARPRRRSWRPDRRASHGHVEACWGVTSRHFVRAPARREVPAIARSEGPRSWPSRAVRGGEILDGGWRPRRRGSVPGTIDRKGLQCEGQATRNAGCSAN
jgi:hypothetical protein